MAEVYNSGIMFDPLYQELVQGLDEIVHESAELGMLDVATEIRKCSKDIKKVAISSVRKEEV